MMKRFLRILGIGFLLLIFFLLIKTVLFTSQIVRVAPVAELPINKEKVSRRLADVLRFQTVFYEDSTKFNAKAFRALHTYLEEAFPLLHATLKKQIINRYSLLYTWEGRESTLKPILFMGHQDVVPVIPDTEKDWRYPPFGGEIAEGFIWGRGALDDKSCMMSLLEAVELLIENGFRPRRTLYFAFGHDEEIGGLQGAAKIAELFQSQRTQFEYVLDEGGIIIHNMIPGIVGPVALVGIAEKGYMSLELTVRGHGGHSSMPPRHTAVGILSQAIVKLEDHPFPVHMEATAQFFKVLGTRLPFLQKMIFANLWLFRPLVIQRLSKSPQTNALIRTTTAATMFSGSVKENVLPIQATAIVNFRIIPGEDTTRVIEYVRKTVDDPRIQIKPRDFGSNPSPFSDIHSRSYELLQKTIYQLSAGKELVVVPYLVVGATDSRYYTGMCNNIYRFLFIQVGPEDLKRVHGTDERISLDNYVQMVRFYYQIIRNSEEL